MSLARTICQFCGCPGSCFNLTMRYYAPLSPVLDKTYVRPAVHRADTTDRAN